MATYAQRADAFRCEQCGAEMAMPLLCDSCGADYPERRAMSPFGLLGLPQRFDLDEATLDAIETRLASRLHPDRWQARGDRLHRKALLAWSATNEALAALRDPWTRGDTLLALQPEVQQGRLARRALPTPFLVGQIEIQEEIASGASPERKRQIGRTVRAELDALHGELAGAFAALEDGEAGRDAALARAREALDRSRYWRNAQRALRGQPGPG